MKYTDFSKATESSGIDSIEEIVYTEVETVFEGKICKAYREHLTKMIKNPKEFYKILLMNL